MDKLSCSATSSILNLFPIFTCRIMLIILLILYSSPIMFDIFPSSDSYLGGIGFAGIWGVCIAALLGIGLSMFYGISCVSNKTAYRCAGFWCNKPIPCESTESHKHKECNLINSNGKFITTNGEGTHRDNRGILFPDKFPLSLKHEYLDGLSGISNEWYTHNPFSKFNRKLSDLNNKLLYKSYL